MLQISLAISTMVHALDDCYISFSYVTVSVPNKNNNTLNNKNCFVASCWNQKCAEKYSSNFPVFNVQFSLLRMDNSQREGPDVPDRPSDSLAPEAQKNFQQTGHQQLSSSTSTETSVTRSVPPPDSSQSDHI